VLIPSAPASPATTGGVDEFRAVVRSERETRLEALLRDAGALLLRGFPARTAAHFDRAIDAFGYEERPYVGGAVPRTNVVGRVVDHQRVATRPQDPLPPRDGLGESRPRAAVGPCPKFIVRTPRVCGAIMSTRGCKKNSQSLWRNWRRMG
jgi:hypothetical protein